MTHSTAILSYSLAVSADGYPAREDGAVDWLDPYFGPMDSPYEHERYYQTVSSLVMGRKTFEKALSFGGYPYRGKPALVVTRKADYRIEEPGVEVLNRDVAGHVAHLKRHTKGRIWLVGGGELASHLMDHSLIDEIVLSMIPVTIGSGIRWMASHHTQVDWRLEKIFASDKGIAQVVYSRRQDKA